MNIMKLNNYDDSQISEIKFSNDALFLIKGIVHDYNNIATIIHGNISVAKSLIEQSSEEYKYLTASEKGVLQAKELSDLLLSYTNGPLEQNHVSLKEVIQEIPKLLLLDTEIKVIYDFPGKEIIIKGVEVEIKQIIRNLVLNAKQAIHGDGVIKISATEINLPENNPYLLPTGKYVALKIENNGTGIPEKDIKRIFEPHYTTKIDGHGLGLAICHSIVKKHQGRIQVSSENDKSTKFEIFLPIYENSTGGVIEENVGITKKEG